MAQILFDPVDFRLQRDGALFEVLPGIVGRQERQKRDRRGKIREFL